MEGEDPIDNDGALYMEPASMNGAKEDKYDELILTEPILPNINGPVKGVVIKQNHDQDGNLVDIVLHLVYTRASVTQLS
jgi:hypothetical protein